MLGLRHQADTASNSPAVTTGGPDLQQYPRNTPFWAFGGYVVGRQRVCALHPFNCGVAARQGSVGGNQGGWANQRQNSIKQQHARYRFHQILYRQSITKQVQVYTQHNCTVYTKNNSTACTLKAWPVNSPEQTYQVRLAPAHRRMNGRSVLESGHRCPISRTPFPGRLQAAQVRPEGLNRRR